MRAFWSKLIERFLGSGEPKRDCFTIVMPGNEVYEWRPRNNLTAHEAAEFALLLHRGANSRQEDWMRLERHLVRIGTMHTAEATAEVAAIETGVETEEYI